MMTNKLNDKQVALLGRIAAEGKRGAIMGIDRRTGMSLARRKLVTYTIHWTVYTFYIQRAGRDYLAALVTPTGRAELADTDAGESAGVEFSPNIPEETPIAGDYVDLHTRQPGTDKNIWRASLAGAIFRVIEVRYEEDWNEVIIEWQNRAGEQVLHAAPLSHYQMAEPVNDPYRLSPAEMMKLPANPAQPTIDELRAKLARAEAALRKARDSLLDIRDLAKPYEYNDNFTFSRIVSHAEYGLHHSEAVAREMGMELTKENRDG